MAHTFLYTTEAKGKPTTIRFRSYTPATHEFEVTVLTDPGILPFKIKLERGVWQMPTQLCETVRSLEPALLDAAEKFTRE